MESAFLVGDGRQGPRNEVAADQPNLSQLVGPSEAPIFEYVGRRVAPAKQRASSTAKNGRA